MARYAEGSNVNPAQSRAEIERTLARFGADQFAYGYDDNRAIVAFRAYGRNVRFELPMPSMADSDITRTATGITRSMAQREAAHAQEVRRRWRSLAMVIKAKLEAVNTGIVTFEDEFLSHILLPDGTTVGQWARPQLAIAYESGKMPALMPGG